MQESSLDVRVKVVATMLEPALSLAHLMALPLDDLLELVATGYFREAEARGLSQGAIARRFGKSVRTIATLKNRSRATSKLLERSRRLAVRRRLLTEIDRIGPAGIEAIARTVPRTARSTLERELDALVAQGLVVCGEDGYRTATGHVNVVRAEIDARLDSLRHFLEAVTRAAYRRFYTPAQMGIALARVLSFSSDASRLADLSERQYEGLRSAVLEADAAADGAADPVQAMVAVCFVEEPAGAPWSPRLR
jgi:hypothetical protein